MFGEFIAISVDRRNMNYLERGENSQFTIFGDRTINKPIKGGARCIFDERTNSRFYIFNLFRNARRISNLLVKLQALFEEQIQPGSKICVFAKRG